MKPRLVPPTAARTADLVVRSAHVLDPRERLDGVHDVVVRRGRIAEIAAPGNAAVPDGAQVVEGRGRHLLPAFVDPHVHLRTPGQEHKEDIETGTRAAAAGGFTTICCMPNTRPVNDQRTVTELIVRRAREIGAVRVRPIGAITHGLEGKLLADIADMKEGGIVAISDDGRPVMNAGLMRRAFEYARTFDLPVVQHAEDLDLSEGGAMNEGAVATRIGVRGQPACAESAMVARDLEIVEWTGARYHVAHVSTARTVALVRDAKRRGLPVTCEVTPHHLALTDEACSHYDTSTKVMPPLRTAADQAALFEGLADGTIDCIATDHAPHAREEKEVPWEEAPMGTTGLETAFAAVHTELVVPGVLPLALVVEKLSAGAALFGLVPPRIAVGRPADLCLIDLAAEWEVGEAGYASRSENCCFAGRTLRGKVLATVAAGAVAYRERAFALSAA